MLCQPCQQFITNCLTTTEPQKQNHRGEVEYPYYHENEQSLKYSTALGCLICTGVTESRSPENNPWKNAFTGTTNFLSKSSTSKCIKICGPSFMNDFDTPDRLVCYAVDLHELDFETATLSAVANSSSFTGSLATLSLAQHWLDTCTKAHTKCGLRSVPDWYPTRLLDLSQDKIRLVQTATETTSGPYATLSHCWGDEHIPVMNSDNHDAFAKTGRLLLEFPNTHADAIQAAKMLGFRYLWIDCYCIMQDGKSASFTSDKAKELTLMKQVYTNSALNIGASSGSGASSGCFAERNALTLCPERIAVRQPGIGKAQIYQVDSFSSSFDRSLYRGHKLFTRGWVLQERLLTSRMLHFAGSRVYWECSEVGLASERLPFDHRGPYEHTNRFDLKLTAIEESESALGAWESIIMEYSGLELSYTFEDKFVALSGIAEHMAEVLDDQYIAGLFKGRLLCQLCWHRGRGSERDRTWRAPSWSWACMNGPVGFAGGSKDALAEYVSSSIRVLDPSNPFGRLESASLTLSGRLLEGRNGDHDLEKQIIEVGSVQISVSKEAHHFDSSSSSFDDAALCAGPSGSTRYLLPLSWCNNSDRHLPHLPANEALIASTERLHASPRLGSNHRFQMRGLLLDSPDARTFSRCGQFNVDGYGRALELLRMWASISPSTVTIL